MNGHEYLAHALKSLGITHVYALSGGSIRKTLPACSSVGIRPIGVRHQQAAALMAAAHNYRSGKLTAIALVSAGPAVTNTATGILVAWDNCWPLLVLAGTFPLSHSKIARPGMFQHLDGVSLFNSITKWSAQIPSLAEMGTYLNRGFHTALENKPGPVFLEIPEEALNGSTRDPYQVGEFAKQSLPIPIDQIHQASEWLGEASRPAVILGKGLRWSEPYEEIRDLVEHYQLPFITSPMGRGFLPDDHPLCFNRARDELQLQADTIIILGARLDWTFRFGKQFARHVKLIYIDIEPEPFPDFGTNSLGIKGDLKTVLQTWLKHLQDQKPHDTLASHREKWIEDLSSSRKDNTLMVEDKINQTTRPMSPHRLMKEIRDFLPRDAICVVDGRDTLAAAQEVLLCYEPATRYTPGSNGCMGIGIPFGIGAKLSSPNSLVVVVTGDMAFGISAMEMETAARHKIPIIVIIVNNDGGCATSVHKSLYPTNHEPVAMYQPRIPYEKIMEACGGYAKSIDHPEEIQPALQKAMNSGMPSCLNIFVDPEAPFKNYMG